MKALCLFLMLVGASAFASGCDLTLATYIYTQTNGTQTTRNYYQYLPASHNSTLWVMLHPTTTSLCPFDEGPMKALADQNHFIVVWPISTVSPISGSFYWEAYDLCYIWVPTGCNATTLGPDDSGFIASLIGDRTGYYGLNTVYVTGMSSGAFMAHRVAFEHQGLVQAVGAASGQVEAWNPKLETIPKLPTLTSSPTVLMLNGDNDNVVVYCGQPNGTGWGNSDFPSSDVSLKYWANNMTCQPASPQLCTSAGVPTPNLYQVHCQNVAFVREPNVCHTWVPGTESVMWTFFTTGVLPPPPPPNRGLAQPSDPTCLH